MWFTVVALAVVAYLPGAVFFRLPIADRGRRSELDAGERAFWAVVLSVALSSIVALVLAALDAYSFERLLLLNVAATVTAAVLARGRLRLDRPTRPGPSLLVPLGLVLLGSWLYFPPAEYVMGGKDPGTYMNEGIQIAQRGGLVIRDPVVASVPERSRDLFFPWHQNPSYYSVRFMGFFVMNPDEGTVLGQFPHLYPVWIAIGYGLNGLSGARQTIGAWAIVALIAVYFAGARLFGRLVAGVACALLAINVAQLWFARYPNAELLMQALLFAALLAFARSFVDRDRFFAPVAGLLLGLLLFLRFDAVLALVGVTGAVLIGLLDGRRPHASFLVPLVLAGALASWYLVGVMRPYAAYPLGFLSNLEPLHVTLLALGGAALASVAVAAQRPALAPRLRRALPLILAAGVVVAAVYAYFVRTATGRIAPHDADALRTYAAFYVSGAVLAAALAGYVLTMRRAFWRDPALLLTIAVFGGFFFYKLRIVPDHFWMARRFLPVILPATLLLASAAALSGVSPALFGNSLRDAPWPRRVLRMGLPLVFLALVAKHFLDASRPLIAHVEYAGLIPRLEQLATRFADDDLVIVESRNASDLHVLGLPLAYIYARNVLVLNTPAPDKAQFADFLAWARTKYREVFFLGGGGTDLLTARIGVEPVASERFQIPEYDAPTNAYPQGVRYKEFDYGLYRFTPVPADAVGFSIDVGTRDDLHVVRFHAKEQSGDTSFRWTRDLSYVAVLGLGSGAREVTFWLSNGGRPPAAPPARVEVALNDRPLGAVTVADGFAPYRLEIPPEVAATAAIGDDPARLTLRSTTWNPEAILNVPDDRDLGVMVDRVEVR